ncbi:hypothetical protein RMSM_03760 [Rhodopirellula maiorica SM1]|uniref:Uncharacterized protein n=1 Tax=Rhodopirellula maiorica SM1 TaxID=1265738 RepID=M5RVA4_9BACT|nr:hypothetical protein RMSM_03760 [Rhodopirellula maiorica SM1]
MPSENASIGKPIKKSFKKSLPVMSSNEQDAGDQTLLDGRL